MFCYFFAQEPLNYRKLGFLGGNNIFVKMFVVHDKDHTLLPVCLYCLQILSRNYRLGQKKLQFGKATFICQLLDIEDIGGFDDIITKYDFEK